MTGSRSHTAELFSNGVLWCCNITSHLPSTVSSVWVKRGGERWCGDGLAKSKWKEVRAPERGRTEERQCNIKKKGGGNIRRKTGESSNAKPAEFERRHWGNQKSSEPVCVVGACVRIHICCTLTSTILPKQSTK